MACAPGAGMREIEEQRKWKQVNIQWTEEYFQATKVTIKEKKPQLDSIPEYNVMLCGCIKSGKSSVINTIMTAIRDEIGQYAYNAREDVSVTRKLMKFPLKLSARARALPINLWDTMGIEIQPNGKGPKIRDLEYVMEGRIKDRYVFDPEESINYNSEYYNRSPPKNSEKMHALVLVMDASTVDSMDKEIWGKIKQLLQSANVRELKWAILLTKCDGCSKQIDGNLRLLFRNREMLQITERVQEKLGIERHNILFMQNYHKEMTPNMEMNILAVDSLSCILKLADHTIECQHMQVEETSQNKTPDLMETPFWNITMDQNDIDSLWSDLSEKTVDLRMCLFGPSGAGKSAFINSAMSEFYQRIITSVPTGQSDPTTSVYREYPLKLGTNGEEIGITLVDTMGLLSGEYGLHRSDVPLVLNGQVQDRQAFNPHCGIQCESNMEDLQRKMHAAVLMVNGFTFNAYDDHLVGKMRKVINATRQSSRDVPCVILVTHIDKVCPHVRKDASHVFRSQQVQDCLQQVHEKLQIPMVDIWPICNYVDDTNIDNKKSGLILLALAHLKQRANDYYSQEQEKRKSRDSGTFSAWNPFKW